MKSDRSPDEGKSGFDDFGLKPRPRTPKRQNASDDSLASGSNTQSESEDPLIGADLGGFHVVRLIAEGGMGRVYEGVQEKPRRPVAIKVMRPGCISPEAIRRFENEWELLGKLRHPNIAQIYYASTCNVLGTRVPYFVMEYIPDALPITKYASSKKLSTAQRLRLFGRVCEAVAHGHKQGIIHRDLKPSNILVEPSGLLKIIDFGIARNVNADPEHVTQLTSMGQLIGTLQYMSPEQFSADSSAIDQRTDVYALGVILYELLTGKPPYELRQKHILDAAQVVREFTPVSPAKLNQNVTAGMESIAGKCLQKDRTRRYSTAAEVAKAIAACMEEQPAPHAQKPKPPSSKQSANPALKVLGLIPSVLLGIADWIADMLGAFPWRGAFLTGLCGLIAWFAGGILWDEIQSSSREKHAARRTSSDSETTANTGDGVSPLVNRPPRPDVTPPIASDLLPGLVQVVFAGTTLEEQIDVRVDGQINQNFGFGGVAPGLPADNFSVQWTGLLRVAESGNYKFFFEHDDGGRLWIDDKLLIDTWHPGVHAGTADVELAAGDHRIRVDYYEGDVTAGINLSWASSSMPRQLIPASVFFHKRDLADSLARAMPAGTRGSKSTPPNVVAPGDLNVPIEGKPAETFRNSLGMELLRIPHGSFVMGDDTRVTLTRDFWLGKSEVSRGQWLTLMKTTPWGPDSGDQDAGLPATHISWQEAVDFCTALTAQERSSGALDKNTEYRLPTDAEWEYACRGGTRTTYSFGNDASQLGTYAWFVGNSEGRPHATGSRQSSAQLNDMHGNVWEWCMDLYEPRLLGGADPINLSGGPFRVLRGGSWRCEPALCVSGGRNALDPSTRIDNLGFRVVRCSVGSSQTAPRIPNSSASTQASPANKTESGDVSTLKNSIGMRLRRIPAGTFTMGAANGADDEKPLPEGVWVPVQVTLKGSKATVQVGEGAPQVFEHASFARPKTNISVGFSFGSLSVKDLSVSP